MGKENGTRPPSPDQWIFFAEVRPVAREDRSAPRPAETSRVLQAVDSTLPRTEFTGTESFQQFLRPGCQPSRPRGAQVGGFLSLHPGVLFREHGRRGRPHAIEWAKGACLPVRAFSRRPSSTEGMRKPRQDRPRPPGPFSGPPPPRKARCTAGRCLFLSL